MLVNIKTIFMVSLIYQKENEGDDRGWQSYLDDFFTFLSILMESNVIEVTLNMNMPPKRVKVKHGGYQVLLLRHLHVSDSSVSPLPLFCFPCTFTFIRFTLGLGMVA